MNKIPGTPANQRKLIICFTGALALALLFLAFLKWSGAGRNTASTDATVVSDTTQDQNAVTDSAADSADTENNAGVPVSDDSSADPGDAAGGNNDANAGDAGKNANAAGSSANDKEKDKPAPEEGKQGREDLSGNTAYERIPVPEEVRGVWFSYHEWKEAPSGKKEFTAYADEVMDNLVELKMNTIYVHVRADADAMYPSDIFPWSKFITGTQGEDPGYDPFDIMVDAAHEHGIRIHAWINPYRITNKDNTWEEVSLDNPARIWYFSGEPGIDRLVLLQDGQYYFNPSKYEVRELIKSGVKEILDNYDVDGIHMDDYFYPVLNDGDKTRWFDYPEYTASSSNLTATEFRRENVNMLLRDLYSMVKEKDESIEFGISPAGNLDNLYSDSQYFADVEKWMSEDGYVDYVIPQLFWGFETKLQNKKAAPWAYKNNLSRWTKLHQNSDVALYIGLPMYLAGTDVYDNNKTSEWLRHDDIISRQVTTARKNKDVSGFVFFSYNSFFKDESTAEVENLMKIIDK